MSKPMKSIISLLALCSLPLIGDARDWHTPAAGSAERAQVMTALRGELAKYDPNAHDLRFVVRDSLRAQISTATEIPLGRASRARPLHAMSRPPFDWHRSYWGWP